MTVGQLKERVRIDTLSTTVDAIGGRTNTLSTGTAIWAKVEHQGASKAFHEGREYQAEKILVTVRKEALTLTDTDSAVLVWQSNNYKIHSITVNNNERFTTLICSASK